VLARCRAQRTGEVVTPPLAGAGAGAGATLEEGRGAIGGSGTREDDDAPS